MATQVLFSKNDPEAEKKRLIEQKINDAVIKVLGNPPSFESARDEYLKQNPYKEYTSPKGIQSIPDETVKGFNEGNILGALGGAIKGVMDYINTPEGSAIAANLAPYGNIKDLLTLRAGQISNDEASKKAGVSSENERINKNLDSIFEKYRGDVAARDKSFVDYALDKDKKSGENLENYTYDLKLNKDKQNFEAGQNQLNRQLQVQLEGLKNKGKNSDQNVIAKNKFADDIDKDPTYKNIAEQGLALSKIDSLLKNPSAIDLKVLPVMVRKAIGDSGNVAVAEQIGMLDYGDLRQRIKNSASNYASGQLSNSQRDELIKFIDVQKRVLEKRRDQILDQKVDKYSKIYGTDPTEFLNIRQTYGGSNGETSNKIPDTKQSSKPKLQGQYKYRGKTYNADGTPAA